MSPIELDDTLRSLIAAIAAAPADDAPRLMFADAIDESGGDAGAMWARLIRSQIDLSRHKWENERHLPTAWRPATAEELAPVRPRHVVCELGWEWQETDFLDALPGWPRGNGPAVTCESRNGSWGGLTDDLVSFVDSAGWDHDRRLFEVTFWRGFPLEVIWQDASVAGLAALYSCYQAVPTFRVRCDDAWPSGRPRPFLVAHPDFPVYDGRYSGPVVADHPRQLFGDSSGPPVYWQPGTSLAPTEALVWTPPLERWDEFDEVYTEAEPEADVEQPS